MCVGMVVQGSTCCPLASCVPMSTLTGIECMDMTKEPATARSCSAQAQKNFLLRKPASTAPTSLATEKIHPKL